MTVTTIHSNGLRPAAAVTAEEAEAFRASVEAMAQAYHRKQFPNHPYSPTIELEFGKRYARLVIVTNQRSAYGFIDPTTGDLLKADGWKRPAKGLRGNIRAADPLARCSPYSIR